MTRAAASSSPSDTPDSVGVGAHVRVRHVQQVLGKPKYPGRVGILIKLHPYTLGEPFEGQLWYVDLQSTSRAQARRETFWGPQLEVIDLAVGSPGGL